MKMVRILILYILCTVGLATKEWYQFEEGYRNKWVRERFQDARKVVRGTESAMKKHKAGQVIIEGKNLIFDLVALKKEREAKFINKIVK